MLLIGLTGSIATGKSTVAALLASPPHSLTVIDADVLARQVVEPGSRGYAAIVKHFGPSTPDLLVEASESMPPQGPAGLGRPLNRPALGRRVFGESEERRRERAVLNGIVHPAVRREMAKKLVACYFRGHWAVVLDIPLLFESGLDRFCGVTIVVTVADAETQMRRLIARDTHLSKQDAEHRVCSQGDLHLKVSRCAARSRGCGFVLSNDGPKEELAARLDEAMAAIRRTSPDLWSWLLLACPPLALAVAAWQFWQNVEANRQWEEAQQQERRKQQGKEKL